MLAALPTSLRSCIALPTTMVCSPAVGNKLLMHASGNTTRAESLRAAIVQLFSCGDCPDCPCYQAEKSRQAQWAWSSARQAHDIAGIRCKATCGVLQGDVVVTNAAQAADEAQAACQPGAGEHAGQCNCATVYDIG